MRILLLLACAAALASCQREQTLKTPELLLRDGWRQFRSNEFDAAEGSFRQVLQQLRGSHHGAPRERRLRADSLYGLGLIASLAHPGAAAGAPGEARGYFKQAVAADPEGPTAPWAKLAVVRDESLAAAEDRDQLAHEYQVIADAYPGTPAGDEAFARRAALLVGSLTLRDARLAVLEIGAFLRQHPQTVMKSGLYALLSKAYELQGDYRDALDAAIASVETRERTPEAPGGDDVLALYRIGMMAQYDVGDFDVARKYYERLLQEFPHDKRAFNVRRFLQHLDATEAALRAGKRVPTLNDLPPTRVPGEADLVTAGDGGAP